MPFVTFSREETWEPRVFGWLEVPQRLLLMLETPASLYGGNGTVVDLFESKIFVAQNKVAANTC